MSDALPDKNLSSTSDVSSKDNSEKSAQEIPNNRPQKNTTTWQTFKRLMIFAKPYKLAFIAAIIGMIAYAGIDSYVISMLKPLIDEGLTGVNPNFMKWAPLFIYYCDVCLAWQCSFCW